MINGLAGEIRGVDRVVVFLRDSYLAKGVPVMMVWWGLWFHSDPRGGQSRERLLAVLAVAITAIFVGRLSALTLPFRDRPLHDAALEVIVPTGARAETLMGWSSFPSDHAVLFFALATGIFLVNRVFGVLLFIHAALIISIPRIYSGLHFPGDILFGALIGIGVTLVIFFGIARWLSRHSIVSLASRYGYISYPLLFFITFQTASMFDSSRDLVQFVYGIARAITT
ncbi:MAG: phosphatase PAP2 family protein [Puniceicoccaceae bacterium]|nr:MAG: phosphatase PAP2 family protein [Puniceicoccaceae bacterium]